MKKHIKYKNACHIIVFLERKRKKKNNKKTVSLSTGSHSGAGTVIKIRIGESSAMLSNKCAKEYHGQSGKHA